MTTTWDLVIPCRDEARALPSVLSHLPVGCRAIVVDNGSTDGTAAVARGLGAMLVDEARAGYGAAVRAGVTASTADVVAVMDGDGSMRPTDLLPLVDAVTVGGATMAVGRRRPTRRGTWPWHARLGNRVVLHRLGRVTGLRLHDLPAVHACRRTDLLALEVADARFGYPLELLVKAARAGWPVVEVDLPYGPRVAGRSKVSGSLLGSMRAARDFARVLP